MVHFYLSGSFSLVPSRPGTSLVRKAVHSGHIDRARSTRKNPSSALETWGQKVSDASTSPEEPSAVQAVASLKFCLSQGDHWPRSYTVCCMIPLATFFILIYSFYVSGYKTGRFGKARNNSEKINITVIFHQRQPCGILLYSLLVFCFCFCFCYHCCFRASEAVCRHMGILQIRGHGSQTIL